MYSSAILEGIMHARWLEDARHSKNAISHTEKPLAQKKNSLRKRMDLRFCHIYDFGRSYFIIRNIIWWHFMRNIRMEFSMCRMSGIPDPSYGRDGSSQGGDHCS
ncbi:hypothetical protein ABFS83_08G155000 [Erythranthe nasuta]